MSRKDFQAIADIIAGIENEATRAEVAQRFARYLPNTNPRFDTARFLAACNVPKDSQ